ncbi:MAG: hypothetical protein SGCHY_002119 [Lobulomycetales sp.]
MEKKDEGKKASAAQNGKSLSLCPIGTFRRAKGPPEDTYVMQKDRAVRMDSGKEGYVCFPCTGKKTGNKYICKLIKELEVAKWHVDELGNYKVPMEVASLSHFRSSNIDQVVRFHEFFLIPGERELLLVFESLDKNCWVSLDEYIDDCGNPGLHEGVCKEIFGNICSGVSAIEQQGFFHGNLNASFIKVNRESFQIKLTNFETALLQMYNPSEERLDSGLSLQENLNGPESVAPDMTYFEESRQVWLLGIILHRMLLGSSVRLYAFDSVDYLSSCAKATLQSLLDPCSEKRVQFQAISYLPFVFRPDAMPKVSLMGVKYYSIDSFCSEALEDPYMDVSSGVSSLSSGKSLRRGGKGLLGWLRRVVTGGRRR